MTRRRRASARLALVGVVAAALVATACFGTVCTRQTVAYTDADGVGFWTVTSCHPRSTVQWRSTPEAPR